MTLEVSGLQQDSQLVTAYDDNGFVLPIDVLTDAAAAALRADLEDAEDRLANDPEKLALLRTYPDRLLPSFDTVIRHPNIIAAVSALLGPDLLVYSGALFIKQPHSDKIVSWHQDLTYWGLDDAEEVTCWLALSPANRDSGCMKFVAGSHKQKLVEHVDTYNKANMLSRGQEIAVDVSEDEAVFAELKPGQASLHHGHLFHASGPNTTAGRRIGMAIRYIRTEMKQEAGQRPLVALASGVDRFRNFDIAATPQGRLLDRDFEICAREADLRKKIFL